MADYDYEKIFKDIEEKDNAERATSAITPEGGIPTVNFDGTPATAKAVIASPEPQKNLNEWDRLNYVEKAWNSFWGGIHNLQKSNAVSDITEKKQATDAGLSALFGSDDMDLDDASMEKFRQAYADKTVGGKYKKQKEQELEEAIGDYIDLSKKDKDYYAPTVVSAASKATEGKGFWESIPAWFAEVSKDPFDYALYIAGSSAGAIAPFLATSMAGGFALNAMKLNSVARAVQAATMGAGSYNVEFGSYIENYLAEKGYDLSNVESVKEALGKEDVAAIREKAFRRAAVVGAFDAISAWIAPVRLNPSDALRTLRRGVAEGVQDVALPASRLHRVGKGLENMTLQTTLQGVMGGAGEAFGQLVNGEKINWGEVFAEAIGEFTTAPVEVVGLAYSANANFNRETTIARNAQEINKNLQDISNVVTAVAAKLPDNGSLRQWCEAVGKDKTLFAFAQDVIDSGAIDKLKEVAPALAKQVIEAAEKKSDVNVPVSDILKLSATDEATARKLLNDVRLTADGMSPNQAEKFLKEGKKGIVEKFNQIIDNAKPDIELRKAIKVETDKIVNELVSTGTTKDVADLQVLPWASWLAVRAKQTGMKPSEIMEKVRLRIEGEGTQVARTETAGIFTEKEIAQYNAISEPPKFDLVTVGKDENGKEHRVLGVNGSPDLMVMPEGIEGIKPLPVRLQEETMAGPHIRKHENQLLTAGGYQSVEQAIFDIAQNWRWIAKGTKEGCVRLLRPLLVKDNGKIKRGVLQVEFQEISGVYRVGSVFLSDKPIKQKDILFDRQPYGRGPLSTNQSPTGLASTPTSLKTDVPSVESIGQVVGNVKGESLFQRGYIGRSESVRASEARQEGQKPLSKWTKKAIIEAMKANGAPEELLRKAEAQPLWVLQQSVLSKASWHHTGPNYQKTDFYGINDDYSDAKLGASWVSERIDEAAKAYGADYTEEAKKFADFALSDFLAFDYYKEHQLGIFKKDRDVKRYAAYKNALDSVEEEAHKRAEEFHKRRNAQPSRPLTQRDAMRALEQLGYHGSPYHFDRFTLSHIGSGEGAQAHGWGLYFALNRQIAEAYRESLADARTTYNGQPLYELHNELRDELKELTSSGKPLRGERLAKAQLLTSKMLLLGSFFVGGKAAVKVEKNAPKSTQEAYKWLTEEVYPNLKLEKDGKVYTAEIPDDDVMLREEKKISEQSEFIQNAVRKATAGIEIKQDAEEVEDFLDGLENSDLGGMPKTLEKIQQMFSNNDERLSSDDSIAQALKDTVHQDAVDIYEWNKDDNDANDITVEEIESNCQKTLKEHLAEITRMARKNGSVDIGNLTGREVYSLLKDKFLSARSTSLYLNKFGIKGMRYNGARDGECAVVWDEQSIKILNALEQMKANGSLPYEVALAEDTKAWEKIVDSFKSNTKAWKEKKSSGFPIHFLRQIPLVFLLVGARPTTVNLKASSHIFDGTHPEMTPDVLKQLPEALANPIALFKSATRDNSYVAMLGVKSAQGATVVVPVEINARGVFESEVNIARSAYAKADSVTGAPKDDWFAEQSRKGNLLYVDEEKLNRWRSYAGSNSLWDLSNGHGHTVMRKDDLVKLREEMGDKLYSGPRGTYQPRNTSTQSDMAGVMQLMQSRDKSTFLHESAHVWLDADTMLAKGIADKILAGQEITDGERAFLTNLGGFFRWGQQEGAIDLGVTDDLATVAQAVKRWSEMSVNDQREMHELFAEGFESYLMSGTAPNPEMRTVFGRFKKWLMDIYARATKQPRPISREVRKLYDLMFATQQQAQDTETRLGLQAMFKAADAKKLGMTDAEVQAYEELQEQATLETEGLVAKMVRGTMRIFGKARQDEIARIEKDKEAIAKKEAELLEEPRYRAVAMLNARQTVLDIRQMQGYDTDTIDALDAKGWISHDGGVSPDVLASMAGTTDAVGLIGDILDIDTVGDAHDEALRILAFEERKEFGDEGVFDELRANLAAYNDTRSRLLTAEYNAIARMLGNQQILRSAAREYAIEQIGNTKMSDLHPYTFVQAEQRCAREAEEALRKGDYAACLEAKRGQVLNHELARAALEAQERMDKGIRAVRRAMKSKTIHPQYKQLIAALVNAHAISNMTKAEREEFAKVEGMPPEKVTEFLAKLEENGTPVDGVAEFLQTHEHVQDMTAYTAEDYFGVVKQVATLGRNVLNQSLTEIAESVKEVVALGKEKLNEAADVQGRKVLKNQRSPMTRKERALNSVAQFLLGNVKIQSWCRIFDRNKDGGFFWNLFIRSANEHANFEAEQRARCSQILREKLLPAFKKSADEDPIAIPGFDRPFTHGMRLAVALNLGNESNKQRLITNDPRFTTEALQAIMDSLTEADWRAVEAVWQLFESFKTAIGEKEMRVYGVEPEWIKYEPFKVKTKEGKTITVSGGYYPVKYDPVASNKVDKRTDAEATEQDLRGAYQSATTRRSFTQSRVTGDVTDMPLRLDLTALYEGLNDVIHDLAWHEWLIDTKRVLDGAGGPDSGLRAAIKERYGYNVAKEFEEWRKDIALGGRSEGKNDLQSVIAKTVGISTMGFSFNSALVQLTGIGYVIPRVGTAAFSVALGKYLTSPFKTRRFVNSQSQAMLLRAQTQFKELAQIRNRLDQGKGIIQWVQENAYVLITIVQGIVDTLCWQAAYERFTREGYEGKELVALCDQTVEDTQASGNISSQSRFERNPHNRIWTVFYSWMNAALNLSVSTFYGEENKFKKVAALLWMNAVMPIIEQTWRDSLKPSDDDDDDDDDDLQWMREDLGTIVEYNLGLLPIVREFSMAAESWIKQEPVMSYSGPAGTRPFTNAINLVQKSMNPNMNNMTKAIIDLAGSLSGLPSTQINNTVKGIRAINSGQAEGFDAIKAPLFGFKGKIDD